MTSAPTGMMAPGVRRTLELHGSTRTTGRASSFPQVRQVLREEKRKQASLEERIGTCGQLQKQDIKHTGFIATPVRAHGVGRENTSF